MLQVEVTMNKENQERVEQYMNESPERVLLATWGKSTTTGVLYTM